MNTQRRTLNSEPAAIRAQVAIEVSPDGADADLLHIRASDETLDRYKEVIVASGWRLDNYLRNPVIQNAHQYGDIIFTIGRAEKTWVSGNALLQTWRFASNENPFAKIARDLYRGKFLQAASVGFIPLKWEDHDPNPTPNLNPNRAGRSVPAEPLSVFAYTFCQISLTGCQISLTRSVRLCLHALLRVHSRLTDD